MTDFLLIRHGSNDWVGDRLAGWTPGVHLNEAGRKQAATLAQRLADWPIEAVYSSPLERAVETAEITTEPHELPIQIEEGVGEARFGEWTGQSIKVLRKTPEWARVQFNPSSARFPGGESLGEMQARVVASLERLCQVHPKGVVLIFSHADVIKAAAAHYAGIHFDLFQRLVIDTASVTWIKLTDHGPRVIRLNDTGTLTPPKLTSQDSDEHPKEPPASEEKDLPA
ncbi:MAG: MSMEG_4193 family putative phosphomutase [Chloroflexota bacterium]|nr:MSMEG_4193 family putative phosphomutase [Chloroflexota bacterium]